MGGVWPRGLGSQQATRWPQAGGLGLLWPCWSAPSPATAGPGRWPGRRVRWLEARGACTSSHSPALGGAGAEGCSYWARWAATAAPPGRGHGRPQAAGPCLEVPLWPTGSTGEARQAAGQPATPVQEPVVPSQPPRASTAQASTPAGRPCPCLRHVGRPGHRGSGPCWLAPRGLAAQHVALPPAGTGGAGAAGVGHGLGARPGGRAASVPGHRPGVALPRCRHRGGA